MLTRLRRLLDSGPSDSPRPYSVAAPGEVTVRPLRVAASARISVGTDDQHASTGRVLLACARAGVPVNRTDDLPSPSIDGVAVSLEHALRWVWSARP
jgi:hypothetical protein